MQRTAVLEYSGVYRYRLSRCWEVALPSICFVMLNPGTADGERDDPTIRRCIGLAKAWGYGTLEVVNLFAYRTSYPKLLRKAMDPIGPENDHYLRTVAATVERVVIAWGNHGSYKDRDRAVFPLLPQPYCLGLTSAGCGSRGNKIGRAHV